MKESLASASWTVPDVTMIERSPATVDGVAWDVFVLSCGGSFLGSWRVIRANRVLGKVRVFEFFAGGRTAQKIAQCAVSLGPGRVRFIDRLHLLPEYDAAWELCLRRVIERYGAASYEYGSGWNREDHRPPSLAGTGLEASAREGRRFQIDRVDFSRWGSFAAYCHDVSENITRDCRKAKAFGASVETHVGIAALSHVPLLIRLRRQVMQRNREPYSVLPDIGTHVLKLLCIGEMAFISTVQAQGRSQAAFFGVRFGGDVYYLAGGTESDSHGCGSLLFLTLIEEGFASGPNWKLHLGQAAASVDPATYTVGNHLYRRKLRATSTPGTAFHLDVRNARVAAPIGALLGSTLWRRANIARGRADDAIADHLLEGVRGPADRAADRER